MARIIYSVIASLDGYSADATGDFQWAAPDEEVHLAINEEMAQVGTYLHGRRMYETMAVWETDPSFAQGSPAATAFVPLWQEAQKIVYSTTLEDIWTSRTRLERRFDPAAVREPKATSDKDLTVDGPTLAAHALRQGLVDELHLILHPVVIGGGLAALPAGLHLDLHLTHQRRFTAGAVQLHYDIRRPST